MAQGTGYWSRILADFETNKILEIHLTGNGIQLLDRIGRWTTLAAGQHWRLDKAELPCTPPIYRPRWKHLDQDNMKHSSEVTQFGPGVMEETSMQTSAQVETTKVR